ncbi:DEAD/DEAH box helicase [Desulfovibrio aminophilus]|nr:DEAD/DEAH box helicase [Desulfovibrio aminophilus]MCM0754612.1 DEAD/DEAH box helicase [Desulfovibrio aminophilus]
MENETPNTTSDPEATRPEPRLEDLPETLRRACDRAGWTALTPVQAKALPPLLEGRDMMVQARTGSGKTGAFVLPMLSRLDPTRPECQALVLVPTRELATQVAREAELLCGPDGPRVVAVYGGVGYGPQIEAFKLGAHIVVGTPGRVLDHLLKRSLTLEHLRMLVFDEADRMLSVGFYPDMKEVQRYLPKRRVHSSMFSATYPGHVLRLAEEFLREPQMLSLSGAQVSVAEIAHTYYEVPAMGRERCLIRIIELEQPTQVIIFCNKKSDVHFLTAVLQQFGYDADELSADLTQAKREQVLARVRDKSLRFLVATDVAGRGIDIPELSHVILYEPPEDRESYIHRSGRTGRAGASGEVISLVDVIQKLELMRIARLYSLDLIRREPPSDEAVAEVVAERLSSSLEAELRSKTPLARERMRRFLPLAAKLAEEDDGRMLLAMLLDERYQGSLGAAPALPEERPGRRGEPRGERGSERRDEGDRPRSEGAKRRRRPRKRRGGGGGESQGQQG